MASPGKVNTDSPLYKPGYEYKGADEAPSNDGVKVWKV